MRYERPSNSTGNSRGIANRTRADLSRDLLGSKLLANGRAIQLDVPVVVADDPVGDLLGLLVDLDHLPPNEPLHREESVLRIHNCLSLRNLPHQPVPVLRERHHRGRRALPLRVRHDGRLPPFHSCHRRVRRPEVNPHHLLTHHPKGSASPLPPSASPRPQSSHPRARLRAPPPKEDRPRGRHLGGLARRRDGSCGGGSQCMNVRRGGRHLLHRW